MRIFFCHSSHNKPLIREIRDHLPHYFDVWIDEQELIPGSTIGKELQNAIEMEMDFVVIFFDEKSIKSDWVSKESNWALKKEQSLNRNFILPVLFDDVTQTKEFQKFKDRLYIEQFGRNKKDSIATAEELKVSITKWVFREYELLNDKYNSKSANFVKAYKDWEAINVQTDFRETISTATTFDMISLSANVLKNFQNELSRMVHGGGTVRLVLFDTGPNTEVFYHALCNDILREKVKAIETEEIIEIISDIQSKKEKGQVKGEIKVKWLCGVPLQYNLWIKDRGTDRAQGNVSVYFYQGRNYTPAFRPDTACPDLIETLSSEFNYVWNNMAKDSPSHA